MTIPDTRVGKRHRQSVGDIFSLANSISGLGLLHPLGIQQQPVVGKDAYGRAERHYARMSIGEICALPVKEHVERNAVLFLWVPAPMLAKEPATVSEA
jgi:hypothetical protein